jgi:hypothetical protein
MTRYQTHGLEVLTSEAGACIQFSSEKRAREDTCKKITETEDKIMRKETPR